MPLSQLLNSFDRELKAELQLILNAVVEGLCGLDQSGNVTFCNDAFLKMTGYRAEEIIGHNLHERVHHSRPDGTPYPAEECASCKALSAHQAIHIADELFWRKDGIRFPVEYWMHPLEKSSKLTEFVATVQDLTAIEQTKHILRRSEEKFRRIVSSVPDVAWTSDRNGRTIYVSPQVEAVAGYSEQEVCAGGGELRLGCIHPKDFGRVQKGYRALFDEQRAFDEVYRIRRKDGVWIWIHDRAVSTYVENGVSYANGVFSDVTSRKQAEAELKSQTAFLEAQANATIDGILVVDGRGRRLLLNQRFVELLQVPPEIASDNEDRILLEYVITLIKDPEGFLARINHLNRHPGETSRDEIELKDGRVLDRYSAPVVDPEGNYYGRIWTFRDISERKRNEDMLQQLSTAVEQSPASVVITDPRGNISYVNRRFTEITGYESQEVLGKNPSILKSGLCESDLYRDLWSTITQGLEWQGEFCNRKKTGDIYWEAATIKPIKNSKGEVTHFIAVKQDITERKRVEEQLHESRQMLQTIFNAIPQRVFWKDKNSIYLGCNRALASDAGLDSPAAIIGKSDFDLSWAEAAELYQADDRMVMRQESPKLNYREQLRKPDGSVVWLQTNKLPLRDRNGMVTGVIATYEDVTEREKVESELQSKTAFLEAQANSTIDGILVVNDRGQKLLLNQQFIQLFKIPSGLVSDKSDSAMVEYLTSLTKDPASFAARVQHLYNHPGETSRDEIEMRDGSVYDRYSAPVVDSHGKYHGRIWTFRDITERKRAEQTLQRSEEKFRSLAENIHEVFWMMSPSADEILYVSPAYDQIWGRPREFLYQNPMAWAEAIHPDDVEHAHSIFARQVLGERIESEYRIRTADGQEKWISDRAFPVRDKDGQVIRVVGIAEETTARKLAERELRLAKASLENASDAIFWADSEGRFVYANEAACRSVEWSREDLVTGSVQDINPSPPTEPWAEFRQRLKAHGSVTFESQHQTKQGRTFPVEVTANHLEFDGQEYIFAFVRDITERRELEGQLRHAQKLEGIGQLAAGIAHEINTPTQFVTDNLTFLRQSWKATNELLDLYRSAIRNAAHVLPPGVAKSLEEAERNCDLDFIVAEVPRAIDQSLDGTQRVAKIIRAMKEFSHPDSVDKTATDLNRAIASTITVARNEWKYVAEIVTEFDETLPSVVCYPGDINQVVLNLLVNAAHAIKEKIGEGVMGRITVRTRRQAEFAEIAVRDTGTGIPEAIRARIFDPFFTTKDVGKGTGQGLALAHSMVVKKHGGKIWFETEPGSGTTFFIALPIDSVNAVKEK